MTSVNASGVTTAEVVVIGGGSAGCAVTRRLVDAGLDVVLVEAGGPDDDPNIHNPMTAFMLFGGANDWGYATVPQSGLNNRIIPVPRGRVLGGSSCLNGMMYVRGAHSDFDAWAAAGNDGWGYDDVLPLFKRQEDFDGGADEYHGVGGPLSVMSRYQPHPLMAAGRAAAIEAGMQANDDLNGASIDGAGFTHLNIKDGQRHNTSRAFLDPIRGAANLTILIERVAQRLLFEGDRCVGVEVLGPDGLETIRAEREVVLSAGTIDSPKLLMLSGIGPAAHLRELDITVRQDLPVGENLHDHPEASTIYSLSRQLPTEALGPQQLHSMYFWRSRSGLPEPDTQSIFVPLPVYREGWLGPEEALTFLNIVSRPESRGTLRLASSDPAAAPLIDQGFMQSSIDMATAVAAIEQSRDVAASPALREWISEELYPGPGVKTREELEDYVRRATMTTFHPVGTCRMGVDDEAVVDPQLRVRGIEGLRVADASIMPAITTGNTHAPTVMIGERASDLVLGAQRPDRVDAAPAIGR